jgi:hypothetical protein
MTTEQEHKLQQVRNHIGTIRTLLDDVMYRMDGLSEKEFAKVRKCYDSVCAANDAI